MEGHTIRVVTLKDTPWFVAADVCTALDIHMTPKGPNVATALKKLTAGDASLHPIEGKIGVRQAKIINEAGLYTLVMRSDKPEAKAFQAWVTGTVLPSIRKDGG